MATQIQLKVLFEGNRMATQTFREKIQQQKLSLFRQYFFVCLRTHMDNRERATATDWK